MSPRIDSLRLVGALGMNKIMAGELSRLSRRALGDVRLPQPSKAGTGALVYRLGGPLSELGDEPGKRLARLAVYYHRSASRVLWDLYESRAPRLEPLYDELAADVAADDRSWLRPGIRISVRARNVADFAAGERQIVGTVKNAIIDGARARGLQVHLAPDEPDVPIAVRMHDGAVTVSLDLAGRSMNQRGYRLDGGEAPIRESLAAALVMLCRHDARTEALVDPMAGSGTIAIEAALMAKAAPLWVPPREPAAAQLPGFGPPEVRGPLFADTEPAIFAADIDAAAVRRARRAAQTAGVALTIERSDFRDLSINDLRSALGERARRGVILCNPPYGERLGAGSDLGPLYRDLGEWCRQLRGWRAGFLIASDEFKHAGFKAAFGGRPRIEKPVRAGGLSARFLLYEL